MNQAKNALAHFNVNGMMTITDHEFSLLSGMIYDHFGIHLTEAKRSLLVRRLQGFLRQQGFTNFEAFHQALKANPSSWLMSEMVNRITTNYTYFNREPEHFHFFKTIALPQAAKALKLSQSRDLRIWCAAASTGEEPYMLIMNMMEYFGRQYRFWDAGLLATDLSAKALQAAVAGRYDREQLQKLDQNLVQKYFQQVAPGSYQVQDFVRKEITYRRFNLVNHNFPFKQPFDVIFCRNVMIYFDQPTKNRLLANLYRFTKPGGYLFIGHSESLMRHETGFKYVQPAVYRKV